MIDEEARQILANAAGYAADTIAAAEEHLRKVTESTTWAFRCGWCGMPCDSDGEPMGDEAPTTDGETQDLNGACCPNGDEPTMVQVTHDMALDAGEPDMKGHWIPW